MEPFKNLFSSARVCHLAKVLKQEIPEFPVEPFIDTVLAELDSLELKARSQLIFSQLLRYLPKPLVCYQSQLVNTLAPITEPQTEQILSDHPTKLSGWILMPVAEFVAAKGHSDMPLAFDLLTQITKRFTAEFAVRSLLNQAPEQALVLLKQRLSHPNVHVRRWVSEGSRPRLPWAAHFTAVIEQPALTLDILLALKSDPSEYVRRSVANHLNDISKDHPTYFIELLAQWLPDADTQQRRLLKHASRTLIKNGDVKVLELWGYVPLQAVKCHLSCETKISIGETLNIELELVSEATEPQPLMLDYSVWYLKKNGQLSQKVFKWKSFELPPGATKMTKKHSFKPVTTRVYHAGHHRIDVQLNGHTLAQQTFELLPQT
ncbi:hypothetical protein [Gayadomonas joobiniege]|uniref:hypothetical protein n=1 Tax=Gayadomonas joobiniege TaxID=1234606 RepID=UPI000379A00E|nr:hypothetical protein [Gayadomonas joobiniege]